MSGRRADDFQTITVRSGRRASDVTRTFGEIITVKKGDGCLSMFFKAVGWLVIAGIVILMLSICWWSYWLAVVLNS